MLKKDGADSKRMLFGRILEKKGERLCIKFSLSMMSPE